MTDTDKAWARLVSLGSSEEIAEIVGNSFTIGRSPENDLSIPNKLVSQYHCKITVDDGTVYLTDTSTNGTQVDGTKVKQRRADLNHGDEIHIVFKKNSAESNVAYVFEQLDKKLSDTFEATQEYEEAEAVNSDPDEPKKKNPKLEESSPDKAVVSKGNLGAGQVDEIEETLLCSICQELLYDCVSLQPCMHTFCAGCFSQWMKTSKACPTCRRKAISVAQNHILRNLIEVYLKSNPSKQRPRDELDVLDENNTIKQPVVALKDVHPDGMDSDYSDEASEDSDDSDDGYVAAAPIHVPVNMNVPVCRQCPGYDASRAGYGVTPAPQSADDFQCTPGTQQHLVCFCCMELFPDRRTTAGIAKVTCDVCASHFCHLYWGCTTTGCRGCLTKLKDMDLDNSALDNLLLQNSTESNILKDYLRDKSLTLKDVIQEACRKLDTGEFLLNNDFNCNFSGKDVKGDSVICYRCGMKALRQLAYFFRKNIPRSDLPEEVRRKPDCYWGKNCRTQKKPGHATKLNHICEQTRFTS